MMRRMLVLLFVALDRNVADPRAFNMVTADHGENRRRLSAVRWGVARQILWAWVLTIPISALVAAASYLLIRVIVRV